MLLRPNVFCTIVRQDGGYDLYGQPLPGETIQTRCAVVKLIATVQKSSVRADSSASRGNAREIVADARLLFSPPIVPNIGDRVIVAGVDLRAVSVFPRFDVVGRLHHYQVDLNVWA